MKESESPSSFCKSQSFPTKTAVFMSFGRRKGNIILSISSGSKATPIFGIFSLLSRSLTKVVVLIEISRLRDALPSQIVCFFNIVQTGGGGGGSNPRSKILVANFVHFKALFGAIIRNINVQK